jgi:hypothetical protein
MLADRKQVFAVKLERLTRVRVESSKPDEPARMVASAQTERDRERDRDTQTSAQEKEERYRRHVIVLPRCWREVGASGRC